MGTPTSGALAGAGNKLQQYFMDLDFFGSATYGLNRIATRNLWLLGCYLFFALGVFARQIVSYQNTDITVKNASFNYSTLIGALVVGLALFPFALRGILKMVTWIFQVKPLGKSSGFNIMHLMTSFALGYFFNLVAQNVPLLLDKFK